jgi:multimeric flavodoxin WrbA
MSGEILILKFSPREKGNSSALADRLATGAQDAGREVERFNLASLDIRPCDGCDLCKVQGEYCVIDDDMQSLYPKLIDAGALVLASPIYWFIYSAQLKLCIDRWYGLWNNRKGFLLGKPVGIILTYGDDDLCLSRGINAIHTLESMLRFLEAPILGLVYGTAQDPGDALKNPALMQAAYDLGRRLAARSS